MLKKFLAGVQLQHILAWTIGLASIGILFFAVLRGPQVKIRWTTENELDIIGYNLYRSDRIDGRFVRINNEVLPPAADPLLGGEHFYTDTDVGWFVTYYYQLESLDRAGVTKKSEPIALRSRFSLSIP